MREHPELVELELHRTGEAPPEVATHLAECELCRAELAFLEETSAAVATPFEVPGIPAEVDEKMLALARQRAEDVAFENQETIAREPVARRRTWPRWAAPAAAAAAFLAVLLLPPMAFLRKDAAEAPVAGIGTTDQGADPTEQLRELATGQAPTGRDHDGLKTFGEADPDGDAWAHRDPSPAPADVPATTTADPSSDSGLAADINGDGLVDVRDALALAIAVEDGNASDRFDLTGEGRVDSGDVDRVARLAVQVKGVLR